MVRRALANIEAAIAHHHTAAIAAAVCLHLTRRSADEKRGSNEQGENRMLHGKPALSTGHSRIAIVGGTLEARRAGIHEASSPTPPSEPIANANDAGSRAVTP